VTLATWLTLGRILLIVPFAGAFRAGWGEAAAVIFAFAALTDWLDGYVARKRGEVSALGAALDPIADKLLTIAALILLVSVDVIVGPEVLAALAIALREVLVGGLREATAGREVKLPVTPLAKIKTTVQFVAFVLLIASDGLGVVGRAGDVALWAATALTVWTGYQYADKAVRALTA
jgi:CDP-diacylglycerol--glycerol-3-phosphate 3-phosphatidyltransferase